MMNGSKIHTIERTVALSNATPRQLVSGNLDRVAVVFGFTVDGAGYWISLNPNMAVHEGMQMYSGLPFCLYIRDYGNIVQQPLFGISQNNAQNVGVWEMILPGFSKVKQE